MRTIEEIQAELIAQKENQPALSGLTSTSKVSEWRLWTYIVAVCTWTLEKLFVQHQVDVESLLLQKLPHTLNWYKNKALAYQHGQSLATGSDEYDNATLSEQVVVALQFGSLPTSHCLGGGLANGCFVASLELHIMYLHPSNKNRVRLPTF